MHLHAAEETEAGEERDEQQNDDDSEDNHHGVVAALVAESAGRLVRGHASVRRRPEAGHDVTQFLKNADS